MNSSTSKIYFNTLALCFPGRTGKQIHAHFVALLESYPEEINDGRLIQKSMNIDIHMNMYFMPMTEKMIANELTELFYAGNQVTEEIIRKKVKFYYFFCLGF